MLKIDSIRVENALSGVITDETNPRLSFSLCSDRAGSNLDTYRVTVRMGQELVWDSGKRADKRQIGIVYEGTNLRPFTSYDVTIDVKDSFGETAQGSARFSTGRLDTPWKARWITDAQLPVPEKSSPAPLVFKREVQLGKAPAKAWVCATALGIYDAYVNGEKLGNQYFAPGFTSYYHQLQYQVYPVDLKQGTNEIMVRVGAGWAVGAFTTNRTNKTYADTQSLLFELFVQDEDGAVEVVASDGGWLVSRDGRMRFADWYDGEVFDATVDKAAMSWRAADEVTPRETPTIKAEYGVPVRVVATLDPVDEFDTPSGERIYDFGQNFAGVIEATIDGRRGQRVVFRHAEVLEDGELFTKPLRTAKAQAEYVCVDGHQIYSPTMTFMGFRYVGVSGIDHDRLTLRARVLSSDMESTGSFVCSDARLNQLQHNIRWGGRSNFLDIPTDCPQRDERMGWTGDIALFAATACFNFDMSRFLGKWLLDFASEQEPDGRLPMTVPMAGDTWKKRATGCWGDACVLVPWAEYLARGDESLLRRQYPMMKAFLGEAERRAKLFSVGKHRRIWSLPFQFGDWCAPDEDFMRWILKGKWVATAYFANSCHIVSKIASILGETEDAAYYGRLFEETGDAYLSLLCRRDGRLKREFQTAYVLPLHFGMASADKERGMAQGLKSLVKKAGWRPRTGFPGTPYLLFALYDHGEKDAAFKTLMNEGCPGWLYAVNAGATTIWERWDALRPDGTVNVGEHGGDGGMVSFNHYANGAVGEFLYRRIAGIEPLEGGYRSFRVAPCVGGGITWAKAEVMTPYGKASSSWKLDGPDFVLEMTVPVSTSCEVVLPSGATRRLASGTHRLSEPYTAA